MNTNFCAFYFCFLKHYSFYPSIITPLASPQPCQSARSIIGCASGVCILLISSLPNLCELWTRGICMFLVSGVEIVSVHDFEGGKFFLFPSLVLRHYLREQLFFFVPVPVFEKGLQVLQELVSSYNLVRT